MTVLTADMLNEILNYLDESLLKLKKDTTNNPEFQMSGGMADFFDAQYETRLQNLLAAKNIDIHHLESGMKNTIIQRKKALLEKLR
ncbi:MAG: hypothetical protein OXC46_09920 [Thaumarchaeota archaeon]|nr:hypothetical protein [Nitrososphaerota archaeon]